MTEKLDMREGMLAAFTRAAESGANLAVVVSDSTSTSRIAPFRERFPDRVIDVGIAEQNLVGVAVGLSLGGFVAVTANAAPFLVARANEQVKNDVCYSQTNVKLVGLNAGVAYGALASTHHAIDDVSIMRGLGNILIFAPADAIEADRIFGYAIDYEGPVYIRMDSAALPQIHDETYRFEAGRLDVLRQGEDLTIAALGSIVHEALAAAEDLAGIGISAQVLNMSSIRPLHREALIEPIVRTGRVMTVEEHSLHGGLGSLVAEIIAEERVGAHLVRLGVPEGEFAKAGPRQEIRAYHGFDRQGIVASSKKLMDRPV
jgi:transketolase